MMRGECFKLFVLKRTTVDDPDDGWAVGNNRRASCQRGNLSITVDDRRLIVTVERGYRTATGRRLQPE